MDLFSSWNIALKTFSAGLKDWGGLHPLIVHFPIALLFTAPLFILLGLIFKNSARPFFQSALILMIVATLGLFLAVSTGEEASESIVPSPDIVETLEIHEHLAEEIRLHFSVLTALFFVYTLLHPVLTKKFNSTTHLATLTLFLIIYACNLVLLLNTAHQGGKLVHHHGVRSTLYGNLFEKDHTK